jgi:hypothetical protein
LDAMPSCSHSRIDLPRRDALKPGLPWSASEWMLPYY